MFCDFLLLTDQSFSFSVLESCEPLCPPLINISARYMSRHLAAAYCAAGTQWNIHGHIWIHRDTGHVWPKVGKWVKKSQAALRVWYVPSWCCLYTAWTDDTFAGPLRRAQRPATDGGLSFVAAWKERSVAAAIVFSPHGGGRHCKMKCECAYMWQATSKTWNAHVRQQGRLDTMPKIQTFVDAPSGLSLQVIPYSSNFCGV